MLFGPLPSNKPTTRSLGFLSALLTCAGCFCGVHFSPELLAQDDAKEAEDYSAYRLRSPAEEKAEFTLEEGYDINLVASEPAVEEPVLTVWDGNGAMYIAEMRSYMQDEKGTGTKTLKNSRIKRLEDTNGDGEYDRVTIFADGLNLPRAILPLDGRIAVRMTDSMDIWSYRDTTGDGVGDEVIKLFDGTETGRNSVSTSVEHQDSGLIWNIDNHIYITYNQERYRFTDGEWKAEKQRGHWTQWGLTVDDLGRIFWMDNSHPAKNIQLHPKYWDTVHRLATKSIAGDPISLGEPYNPDFIMAASTCLLNDRGGSSSAKRGFTSACGQSIYRADQFPSDSYGDYFFADPTIHVIRQANVVNNNGKVMLERTGDPEAEFLQSSDINSRFINTAVGPNGALYITDMYRGIIQDAGWLSPGPRAFIKKVGLSDNNRHGRIWRITHNEGITPAEAAKPRMFDESTIELVAHLEHPHGWWRDTAQRLIILRDDRDAAIPALGSILKSSDSALARLHALWTLEGCSAVSDEHLDTAMKDSDEGVRAAAIQVAEALGKLDTLGELVSDPSPRVAEQLIYSLGTVAEDPKVDWIQTAARNHMTDQGVMMASIISLWGMNDLPLIQEIQSETPSDNIDASAKQAWTVGLSNWTRGLEYPEDMSSNDQRWIRDGETMFYKTCISCHGGEGDGMKIPGTDLFLAPSLVDSPRVKGDPKYLIPILTNGLIGPLDGKTYQAGYMAPAKAMGITRDDHLAKLISYMRFKYNGDTELITADQVKELRLKHEDRSGPWTQEELEQQ